MPSKPARVKIAKARRIAAHGPITHAVVSNLLAYDARTGVVSWRVNRPNGIKAGAEAGRTLVGSGYRMISILERQLMTHRVAWLLAYKRWPVGQIDHINGDPHDNRLCNLRESTPSENQANRKRLTTNSSGARGVTWHKACRKWQAAIKVDGRNIHLGLHSSVESAARAYADAAVKYFGDYAA